MEPLDLYRQLVEAALADFVITDPESRMLDAAASAMHLTDHARHRVHSDVLADHASQRRLNVGNDQAAAELLAAAAELVLSLSRSWQRCSRHLNLQARSHREATKNPHAPQTTIRPPPRQAFLI